MMVPSRSRKTAGASVSAGRSVIVKTGPQFISRYCRGAKFADYDRTAVIGNFRCLPWRSVAAQGEREECNRRIAGSRNIEHLPSFRRNVVRLFTLLKKHHPLFTERDQQELGVPFVEQSQARFQE